MGKAAKIPCVYCDGRLEPGLPFCSSCEQPTMWATNEQRTAWELRQWRMKRATPPPAHVSARVEAIVGATALRDEPVREAPARPAVSRPTFTPHPNGVWGSGRTAGARAPWPPKPDDTMSNGNPHLTSDEDHLEPAAAADDDPPTEEVPPFVLEVEWQAPAPEHAPTETVFTPEAEDADSIESLDDDPEWSAGPDALAPEDKPAEFEEERQAAEFDVAAEAVAEIAPAPTLEVFQPEPVAEPVVEAPSEAARQETELVRELLRRVEEIEKRLDQQKPPGFFKRFLDSLVVHDAS